MYEAFSLSNDMSLKWSLPDSYSWEKLMYIASLLWTTELIAYSTGNMSLQDSLVVRLHADSQALTGLATFMKHFSITMAIPIMFILVRMALTLSIKLSVIPENTSRLLLHIQFLISLVWSPIKCYNNNYTLQSVESCKKINQIVNIHCRLTYEKEPRDPLIISYFLAKIFI
jgi:hypothetical protein